MDHCFTVPRWMQQAGANVTHQGHSAGEELKFALWVWHQIAARATDTYRWGEPTKSRGRRLPFSDLSGLLSLSAISQHLGG